MQIIKKKGYQDLFYLEVKKFSLLFLVYPILWNDTAKDETISDFGDSNRGLGIKVFGQDVIEEVCNVYGCLMFIRGHKGYSFGLSGRIITLFHSANYCKSKSLGSFLILSHKNSEKERTENSGDPSLSLFEFNKNVIIVPFLIGL